MDSRQIVGSRKAVYVRGRERGLQYIQGSFMTSSARDKGPGETLFPSLLDTY